MRWKRVAWVSCLAPVGAGCHTTVPAAHDRVAERGIAHTEAGIEREIRRDAREAWRAVRSQFPNKLFTAEFHDGFIDGYVDYLDRGGDASPPAVPPPRYTRNKKYFTPEGHALIRDYFLGFKYGVDVAVATGHRQYLTVPVLIPDQPDPVPAPVGIEVPVTQPPTTTFTKSPPANLLPSPRPLPAEGPLAGPDEGPPPVKSPAVSPPDPGVPKFGSVLQPATPAADQKIPPPIPAVPIPSLPGPGAISTPEVPARPVPPVVPAAEQPVAKVPVPRPTPVAPVPELAVKLPTPPAEVPDVPAGTLLSSAKDDIPVLPPNFTLPPPLPANHPDTVRP